MQIVDNVNAGDEIFMRKHTASNRVECNKSRKVKQSNGKVTSTKRSLALAMPMLTSPAILDCDKNCKMMITMQYRKNESLI